MADGWSEYQEQAAEFFRSIGVDASTNVTVQGVRTAHDIDVLVKLRHVGFDVTWLIECKNWARKVSKLHVLALREIVTDVGADRGILLCEAGFQSGAVEAARLTNVLVSSLSNVRETSSAEVLSMRLMQLYDRVELCRERYWSIPKDVRIRYGLVTRGQFTRESGSLIFQATCCRGHSVAYIPSNANQCTRCSSPRFRASSRVHRTLRSL